MCIQQPPRSNTLISVGLMAFAAANLLSHVLRRAAAVPESVADPVTGFLYGVAIAAMLIGIRRQVRANRDGGV